MLKHINMHNYLNIANSLSNEAAIIISLMYINIEMLE